MKDSIISISIIRGYIVRKVKFEVTLMCHRDVKASHLPAYIAHLMTYMPTRMKRQYGYPLIRIHIHIQT